MAINPQIQLNKFYWTYDNGIYVTGFAFIEGKWISGKDFCKHLHQCTNSIDKLCSFLQTISGQYSLIVDKEKNEMWLACSATLQQPLFFFSEKDKIIVTDTPENIGFPKNQKIDFPSEIYFKTFGVTPSNQSLVENVFQVRPAEILLIKNNTIADKRSFLFEKQENNFLTDLDIPKLFRNNFEKHFEYLKNRAVFLPLTRGYDSRLLACLLKEFKHENVTCVTWGRANNVEVETAKKVAAILGFKHIFIPYTENLIKDFYQEPSFIKYCHYTGHFSSMPFLQDYFAIKYLQEKEMVSPDSVFIPGNPGDYLRGEHLDQNFEYQNKNKLINQIIEKFGTSSTKTKTEITTLKKRIEEVIDKYNNKENWQDFNQWDFEERQCKFIANSGLVYSFFGYGIHLPLFDTEILGYFNELSLSDKKTSDYYDAIESDFFKKHQVNFDLKERKNRTRKFLKIKSTIRKISPAFIKKLYYPSSDIIFYKEITKQLIDSESGFKPKKPSIPIHYNHYIISWYLYKIKKMLVPSNTNTDSK